MAGSTLNRFSGAFTGIATLSQVCQEPPAATLRVTESAALSTLS